jgi:viologen exporter family transport system permease protein
MTVQAQLDRDRFVPRSGVIRGWLDLYVTFFKVSILSNLQYRVANYFYMIGMIAEPIIYLVVWSTIARQQGGEVGGFTPGAFAAYYIVWTLVRQMNIIFTPYGWEERIRQGDLSVMLLQPVFPIHRDIAMMAGWKIATIIMWLPVAAVLTLLFSPDLNVRPVDVAVFAVAIWGAYLVRTMLYWILGMVSFWTTRVGPLFELVITAELLLSGRLVPLTLMPDWAQRLADFFPFKWTFGFPIEALIGRLPERDLLGGLAMQVVWIVIGWIGVRIVWRFAIRRYSAVSG